MIKCANKASHQRLKERRGGTGSAKIACRSLSIAFWLCGMVLLGSCAQTGDDAVLNSNTSSAELNRKWSGIPTGHYQMMVTARRGSSARTIRRVEAWWDTQADVLRVEEYDAHNALYWILVKKGDTVHLVDVSQRKAQKVIAESPGLSSMGLFIHPYSFLWQRASLPTVQMIARDPLRTSTWGPVREDEQVREAGDRVFYTWKMRGDLASVSVELLAGSLLPCRCAVIYPNGKTVEYTYQIITGANLPKDVLQIPQVVSSPETITLRPDPNETVALLFPSPPDAAEEGPGEPDPFTGGRYSDWYTESPNVRWFRSLRDFSKQTGIILSIPRRWGHPKEIVYVKDVDTGMEAVRLTFKQAGRGVFRMHVERLQSGVSSSQVEEVYFRFGQLVQMHGQRVRLDRPMPPYSPAWGAIWYDERRRRVITLEYIGSEAVFMQLLEELLNESSAGI